MLSWASILYGAALSAVVAGVALAALARPRPTGGHPDRPAGRRRTGGLDAILRATPTSQFFTDAPLRLLPASWQDTAPAYCPGHHRRPPRGRATGRPCQAHSIGLAVLCGLAAFLVEC
jgi:hypothetical protein